MLRALNQKNEPDPKIAELNNMLDKVMAIQHPELRKDSGQKNIMSKSEDLHITTVSGDNSITAVIPEKQTLVSGATIRLRTTDSFRIGKIRIPSDQLIYGVVSLSNERLRIIIKTLRAGNNILPINLEVFDMDGLAGLYIPGSISRDVSKESFDQGMNGIGLSAFDPSIGAQAASAGIQAAKTLISRKVKLVRVTIEDGYQVLLKESH
jgi:conjugative transposon TraM protein